MNQVSTQVNAAPVIAPIVGGEKDGGSIVSQIQAEIKALEQQLNKLIGVTDPGNMDDAEIQMIGNQLLSIYNQLEEVYNGDSSNPLDQQWAGSPIIADMLDIFQEPVSGKASGTSLIQALLENSVQGDDTDLKDVIAALNANGHGTGWSSFVTDLETLFNNP